MPSHLTLLILSGTLLTRMASAMSLPFLALFLSYRTELAPGWIGLVVGLQPVAACFSGFFGGVLSDRLGRKRLLQFSLFSSVLVFLGFFFLSSFVSNKILLGVGFSVLNILNGLCASFYPPISQALLADLTPVSQRPRILQIRYMVANIGTAVGPLIGASIGLASSSLTFLTTATLYFIFGLTLTLQLRKIPFHAVDGKLRPSLKEAIQILVKDHGFARLVFASFLFSAAYAQIEVNLSQIIGKGFPGGVVLFSRLYALNAASVVLLQPLMVWRFHAVNPRRLIWAGNWLVMLSSILMIAIPMTPWSLVAFVSLVTVGEVLVVPTQSVATDLLAPPHLRGTYFGAATLRQLGTGAGPILGGLCLSAFGVHGVFAFMAICTAIAGLINSWNDRTLARRSAPG